MERTLSSVQFSHSVISDSLQPRELHHTSLPCPLPTPRAYSNSCPSSQWCHPTISSSVTLFSSCLQSFSASESSPVSQFFTSDGQSIGASAPLLTLKFQVYFLWDWLVWSPCSPRDSQEFSSTAVWKHQFFGSQPSLGSNCHIHTWLLEKP